ncbi:hypothetical protein ACNPQM_32670 [Streptomyces sp. NPDC056231]|uniref:hypothetical protein n=1 Tax=Streptomyces sp. NPDC056231 TaxID=3345755 RepID=UPI003AAE5FFA
MNVATTHAAVDDSRLVETVHDNLERRDAKPGEHLVDGGYTSAEIILTARAQGIDLVGPLPPASNPLSACEDDRFAECAQYVRAYPTELNALGERADEPARSNRTTSRPKQAEPHLVPSTHALTAGREPTSSCQQGSQARAYSKARLAPPERQLPPTFASH